MEPLSKWRLPDILCFDSARSWRVKHSGAKWTEQRTDVFMGLKSERCLWTKSSHCLLTDSSLGKRRSQTPGVAPKLSRNAFPSLFRHVFSSDKHTNDVTMDFGPSEKCLKFCAADWIFQGLKKVNSLHADKENEWKWNNTDKNYIVTQKNI